MKTREIVFTKPYTAELLDNEIFPPKGDEVQVRLAVSTISSGTERANLIGDKNLSYKESDVVNYPIILGYSSAGTVTATGENVTEFKTGDRVALSWSNHSQFININKNNIHKLPCNVSFNDGALVHISTFPLAALRKCRIEIGESAIIMGMGVLGLISIPLLKASGAVPVIAVDPVPKKREKALSTGADYALDPFAENFADEVKKLTKGGANIGIEVTGSGSGLDGILDCMAKFGRVALLGCTRNKDFTIDYYRKIHGPGITLVGAHTHARPLYESHSGWWTEKADAEAILTLIQMGRFKLSDIVDEIHSPLKAPQIYERLAVEKSFPVVQFDWSNLQ